MDYIEHILTIAVEIYKLVEQVKANKKSCKRVGCRVEGLTRLVNTIKKREKGQISADVEKALEGLNCTLVTARDLIEKFTSANWAMCLLKSGSHAEKFNIVNDRLSDAFQILSGSLQVEDGDLLKKMAEMFEQSIRVKEDEEDREEDDSKLEKLLKDFQKEQEKKLDDLQKDVESIRIGVEKMVVSLKKPSTTDQGIRLIEEVELKYDYPKEPFCKTFISEVYRGTFSGFSVAIKRYTHPVNSSTSDLKKIFHKEVETMKRFESPNILRMFGICVKDEGPVPQFLLIMEYCENGSLRVFLDTGRPLSWIEKARMCRDAARGVYRLHQSEQRTMVHGSINSSKFLVAEGNVVKLGGFELAKTETSLRRTTKSRETETTLCYSSPQMLCDVNHKYSKECEIYSFGIVLWEIATRSKPFEGWSEKEILKKVGKERFQQELKSKDPEECPEKLAELINACRGYEGFKRPSAGVLVDKLQSVVTQLEKQKKF